MAMNLEAILSHAVMLRLGWALLHFVWQGAALGALTWGALRLLRQHSANARYAVACLALAVMAVFPVASLCLSPGAPSGSTLGAVARREPGVASTGARAGATLREAGLTTGNRPPTGSGVASASAAPGAPYRWFAPRELSLARAAPWVALVWLIGVLVCAVRLSGGWALSQYLRQVGVSPAAEWLSKQSAQLSAALCVCRPVRLL